MAESDGKLQQSSSTCGTIKAEFYDDCSAIPDPADLDPSQKNLLLLDDCFLGKQNKAEAYYTCGRHNNCNTLYIAQNYFRLPRLFRQDDKNLAHLHADHCADDMTLQEFKQLCHRVWKQDHNFVTIDLTSPLLNGKYLRISIDYISRIKIATEPFHCHSEVDTQHVVPRHYKSRKKERISTGICRCYVNSTETKYAHQ